MSGLLHWQITQRQSLPLEEKVAMTKMRIRQFYETLGGDCVVSFSGGKDSTILLHICREMYPDIRAMFLDTGLEFPEIRNFVKTFDNVEWVRPKKNFKQVVEEYGWPIISKEVAAKIYRFRQTNNQEIQNTLLDGTKSKHGIDRIPIEYQYLLWAPFKISDRCCYFLKKAPANSKKYHHLTGEIAAESRLRHSVYRKKGCIASSQGLMSAKPMSFWMPQDVLQYIKTRQLPICSLYGDVVDNGCGECVLTGEQRTGCMLCLFGIHFEKHDASNKILRLKELHPGIYQYGIKLGMDKVLEYMGVKYL